MDKPRLYLFDKFPFPPSVNSMYPVGKHGKKYSSEELRNFKAFVDLYAAQNRQAVQNCSEELKFEIAAQRQWIQVSTYVVRPASKIWNTHDRKMKESDVANRIKATHDALANIIGIDDRYFSVGPTEFIFQTKNTQEYCILLLKPVKIKSISTLSEELSTSFGINIQVPY